MPQNLVPLVALLGLIGCVIWFVNIEPPPPLPACDDPAQTAAIMDFLSDAATKLIHETREADIRSLMSLSGISQDDDASRDEARVCDAVLNIAARGRRAANTYRVRYAIERSSDSRDAATPRLTDLRRTQLPPCDAPDLFDDALAMAGDWPRRSVGRSFYVQNIGEASFDAATQKRRCTGEARGALDPPTRTRRFTGVISWADREAGGLMTEAWFE